MVKRMSQAAKDVWRLASHVYIGHGLAAILPHHGFPRTQLANAIRSKSTPVYARPGAPMAGPSFLHSQSLKLSGAAHCRHAATTYLAHGHVSRSVHLRCGAPGMAHAPSGPRQQRRGTTYQKPLKKREARSPPPNLPNSQKPPAVPASRTACDTLPRPHHSMPATTQAPNSQGARSHALAVTYPQAIARAPLSP